MRRLGLLAALLVALVVNEGSATAIDVIINGVKVGAVGNVEMTDCTVRFDEKGNVHITAPGYDVVKPAPPGGTSANQPERKIERQYYLKAAASGTGTLPYRFEIFVNAKSIGEVRVDLAGTVLPLNEHLTLGKNQIGIRAVYDSQLAAVSNGQPGAFEVLVGEGRGEGASLDLTPVYVRYKRYSKDTGDREDTYTFVVQ